MIDMRITLTKRQPRTARNEKTNIPVKANFTENKPNLFLMLVD